MVQNASLASPGSLSGGRSTIAEKSQRSRGIMEVDVVVMGRSLRSPATIKRNRVVIHRGHATPGSATSSRPLLLRIAYAGTNARLTRRKRDDAEEPRAGAGGRQGCLRLA